MSIELGALERPERKPEDKRKKQIEEAESALDDVRREHEQAGKVIEEIEAKEESTEQIWEEIKKRNEAEELRKRKESERRKAVIEEWEGRREAREEVDKLFERWKADALNMPAGSVIPQHVEEYLAARQKDNERIEQLRREEEVYQLELKKKNLELPHGEAGKQETAI